MLSHDAHDALPMIQAPALITFGRYNAVCSTRFAEPLSQGIRGSEVTIFEDCSHARSTRTSRSSTPARWRS
jgi:pimeloyl-ACP methyl ester carboxylesterase